MATSNPRYDGKPLLRLIELYVLWAIGQLSAPDASAMEAMTPKLRKVYATDGTWQQIIAGVLHFPPDLPGAIRELWDKNIAIAKQNCVVLPPQKSCGNVRGQ